MIGSQAETRKSVDLNNKQQWSDEPNSKQLDRSSGIYTNTERTHMLLAEQVDVMAAHRPIWPPIQASGRLF